MKKSEIQSENSKRCSVSVQTRIRLIVFRDWTYDHHFGNLDRYMGRTQWAELPDLFPTHLQDAKFWEELGCVVATFGFLEEILGRAIFAHTATRRYAEEEVDAAYREWLPKLERALHDPLGKLIDEYAKAVHEHPDVPIQDHDLDDLIDKLRIASKNRNMLCHASWGLPTIAVHPSHSM